MPPPSQPQPSPGPPPASPPSSPRKYSCRARLELAPAGSGRRASWSAAARRRFSDRHDFPPWHFHRTSPESHPKCFANEPDQAGSASPRQCKPCPLRLRGTATPGCAPFLPSPHLSQPLAANPDAPVSPGKPLLHMAQNGCWPLLPCANYSSYTSSGRTAPARKSRASSSQKNSSTPPPQSRHVQDNGKENPTARLSRQ